jgi:hypothetical protein
MKSTSFPPRALALALACVAVALGGCVTDQSPPDTAASLSGKRLVVKVSGSMGMQFSCSGDFGSGGKSSVSGVLRPDPVVVFDAPATPNARCDASKPTSDRLLMLDFYEDGQLKLHADAPPGKFGVRARRTPSGWSADPY